MANTDLPGPVQKALAYWGVIEAAADLKMTTADMWSRIHDVADDLGLASPGVSAIAVGRLRGIAGQIQERGRQFAALPDSARVTGRYVSTPPWARAAAAQRALPMFAVRYRHTYLRNDEATTEWRTSVFTGRPAHTAGQLRELIALDAANLAREYGTTHVGVDSLQVMAL